MGKEIIERLVDHKTPVKQKMKLEIWKISKNIKPVAQETVGRFCQDSLDIDYAFQLLAAYFRQQKDNTFNSFISLSF